MEISIQVLATKNAELANDIKETASRIASGADIELFRHDFEQIRKLSKAPPPGRPNVLRSRPGQRATEATSQAQAGRSPAVLGLR